MTTPSNLYVVDTHALVWFLLRDQKLSARVRELLRAAERGDGEVIVPTIVLAEGITIEEKGRLDLPKGRIFEWVLSHSALIVADFDLAIVEEMQRLGSGLELHDRIIAATARVHGAAVLTRDPQIARLVDSVWE